MDAAPAPNPKSDFRTIGHSGGTVTINVSLDPATSRKRYQLTWNHCRPNAGGLFAVYALPPGIVISQMNLGGIGSPIDPPPVPGAQSRKIHAETGHLLERVRLRAIIEQIRIRK